MRALCARMRLSAHDALDASRAHGGAPHLRAGRLSTDLERAAPQLRPGRRQRILGYEFVDSVSLRHPEAPAHHTTAVTACAFARGPRRMAAADLRLVSRAAAPWPSPFEARPGPKRPGVSASG